MITREEILRSPDYWFEEAQNELYRQVVEYMEREGLNQTQLAERLNVSKGYVSQLLRGEFNHSLRKLIDLSLSIGLVPIIDYRRLQHEISKDRKEKYGFKLSLKEQNKKIMVRRKLSPTKS